MKKKIVVLSVVLALLMSVTVLTASANQSTGNTGGSIDFTAGGITIIPPEDDCCPCYGEDPCPGCCGEEPCDDPDCPCPNDPKCEEECVCICHDDDDDYNRFFLDNDVVNDLYFGNHNVREFGRFDSANTAQTTEDGQFTGAEVRNFSGDTFQMGVSVGPFFVGKTDVNPGTPTLLGAELFLVAGDYQAPADYPLLPGFEHRGSDTTPIAVTGAGTTHVMTLPNANMVKASWSGLLDILQGTAVAGKAQAELTWTAFVTP